MPGAPQKTRTLEMILTFPESIPFAPDALGHEFSTRLAGRLTTVTLPRFRWKPSAQRYMAVAPSIKAARQDVDWETHLGIWAWGSLSRWQTQPSRRVSLAHVSHAVATLSVPRGLSQRQVEDLATSLASDSSHWWLSLREWLEVTTPYLLEAPRQREVQKLVHNTRAWLWDDHQGGRSVPVQETLNLYGESGRGVRRVTFEALMRLVGENGRPPTMHLFLR